MACQISGSDGRLIAKATRVGSLYYLDCEVCQHTSVTRQDSNTLWHQRFGHLNERSLQKLARDNMVKGLDFNHTKDIDFCVRRASRENTRRVHFLPVGAVEPNNHWILSTVTCVERSMHIPWVELSIFSPSSTTALISRGCTCSNKRMRFLTVFCVGKHSLKSQVEGS